MQARQGVSLVIYDLDGVLIDSSTAIVESFSRTMSEAGLSPQPEERIKEFIGYSLNDIFRTILPEEQHHRVDEMKRLFRGHFSELCLQGTYLLDGVAETLQVLQERGLIQCLATNKHSELARKILEHLGVTDYFSMIVGASDVPNPKPEPDMIKLILREYAVEPRGAVFVDDTALGLTAGKRAGTITVGITTGYDDTSSFESISPDHIIECISELVTLL